MYRLTVEGELDDHMQVAFEGMTLTRADGKTLLTGHVRDQAELQGFLQRLSDFGLTLLEAKAVDDVHSERSKKAMGSEELLGPVDYLVVEFPADKAKFSGEMATELLSLVDRELIRVLDLVLLEKDTDGSVELAELAHADETAVGELLSLEGDLALLLAAEDIEKIGEIIEPGSIAAVLVYENRWAAPFGSAIRRSGGQLVANGRIPTQSLVASMESELVTEGV